MRRMIEKEMRRFDGAPLLPARLGGECALSDCPTGDHPTGRGAAERHGPRLDFHDAPVEAEQDRPVETPRGVRLQS